MLHVLQFTPFSIQFVGPDLKNDFDRAQLRPCLVALSVSDVQHDDDDE